MTKTPGYNRRLSIWFSTNKQGRKQAFYWGGSQMRAFRLPLADAELFVATGQADRIDGHPMRASA